MKAAFEKQHFMGYSMSKQSNVPSNMLDDVFEILSHRMALIAENIH